MMEVGRLGNGAGADAEELFASGLAMLSVNWRRSLDRVKLCAKARAIHTHMTRKKEKI